MAPNHNLRVTLTQPQALCQPLRKDFKGLNIPKVGTFKESEGFSDVEAYIKRELERYKLTVLSHTAGLSRIWRGWVLET